MSHISTKIYSGLDKTSATITQDPPFDFSFAKSAALVFRGANWGNADNTLKADVYWGVRKRGLLGISDNITWEVDSGLTKTINATATLADPVAGVLSIPVMKSKFMKVVFTLSGTAREVDLEAWIEQQT